MSKREDAKRVLCHYLKHAFGVVALSQDEETEIKGIVDDIVDAAVEECREFRYEARREMET
jgi:hypothetical protein